MVGGGGRGVLVRDGVKVTVEVGELVSVHWDVMVMLGAEIAGAELAAGVTEIIWVGVTAVIRFTMS